MLLIIMLAFIAGAFLGYYLLRSGILGHARIVELEQALAATETELADYKPVSYTHLTLPTNREV